MIEKNIRLQPHHSRDLLVGRRSDGKRPKYQPPGGGATSLGSGRDYSAPSHSGGGREDREGSGGYHQIYSAPTPTPVSNPNEDRAREEKRIADAIESKRMEDLAKARRLMTQPADVLMQNVRTPKPPLLGQIDPYQQSYIISDKIRTAPGSIYKEGDYDDIINKPTDTYQNIFDTGAVTQTPGAPKLATITNFGDDAKTKHLRDISTQATIDWNNKTTREKEEQQEKWDVAESKVKLQKEGSIWKTLGNLALSMLVPALLPAELARGYNLYKTASKASAFAKKIGLTEQDAVQYVKNNLLKGKDLTSLVAGDKNVIAKNMAKFSGKGDQEDSNEEYTEKIVQAVDQKKDYHLTNEQRQTIIGQLNYIQRILQQGYFMDAQGERQELNEDRKRQLLDFINSREAILNQYPKDIKGIAHGGRIDKALEGRNRYI